VLVVLKDGNIRRAHHSEQLDTGSLLVLALLHHASALLGWRVRRKVLELLTQGRVGKPER
jgi:hypothetical protein